MADILETILFPQALEILEIWQVSSEFSVVYVQQVLPNLNLAFKRHRTGRLVIMCHTHKYICRLIYQI